MKAAFLALAVLAATAGTSLAGPCEEGLRKLDEALKSETIAPDVRAEAEDMGRQARQLCEAGNEVEGAEVLAEAVVLLGAE